MDGLYRRVLTVFQSMGWNDGVLYLAAQAVRALSLGRLAFLKYYFVSQPIPSPSFIKGRGQSISVFEIDQNDPRVGDFPRPPHVIQWRFAVGARCFLATRNDRFIGYLWIKEGSYDEDEVRCRFTPVPPKGAVWDFDVYVDPAERNGLAFLRLWDTASEHLSREGVAWSVSRIAAFNPASIDSHTRLGAFPTGQAYFLKGARWQMLFSGTSPYLHLSTGRHKIPEIHIEATPEGRKSYRRFRRDR